MPSSSQCIELIICHCWVKLPLSVLIVYVYIEEFVSLLAEIDNEHVSRMIFTLLLATDSKVAL